MRSPPIRALLTNGVLLAVVAFFGDRVRRRWGWGGEEATTFGGTMTPDAGRVVDDRTKATPKRWVGGSGKKRR